MSRLQLRLLLGSCLILFLSLLFTLWAPGRGGFAPMWALPRPDPEPEPFHDRGAPPASSVRPLDQDPVILREVEGYLDPATCDHIRKLAVTKGFVPSRVVNNGLAAGATDSTVRDSEQVWLKPEEYPEVMKLYRRVEKMTGVPMERYEDMQVVRYQNGTQYKEHYDDCQDDDQCEDFWRHGGRRVYTVIVYLNGPEEIEEGGETVFPRLGQSVTPTKGKMVWFRNLQADGMLEKESLHAARPVTKGIKYGCQIWIRQRERPERVTHKVPPTKRN